MTGRPETLEAALAWLAKREGEMWFVAGIEGEDDPHVQVKIPGCKAQLYRIRNGDIPAAIVEAVGQVFDAVNGKGEA